MLVLIIIAGLSVVAGLFLPLRWGVFGFLAAAAVVFLIQVGIHTALGFEGTSIEESLLLFNGSWAAYVGFNLQITYRAFALPLVLLAGLWIFRAGRGAA